MSKASHQRAKSSESIQRKMETNRSMKAPDFSLEASKDQNSKAAQTGMPEDVRAQMESSMGADFSDVRVHKDSDKAEQMGALAYAQGNEVHFAKGQYDPGSKQGKELLGHELAHVVQQREGRVAATGDVAGQALNDSASLENEADRMGKQAAEGAEGPVQAKKASGAAATGSAPVQRFKMRPSDIERYPKFAKMIQEEMPKAKNDHRLQKYLEIFGTNQGETARDIEKDLQWGEGPEVHPWALPKSASSFRSNQKSAILRLSRDDIEAYENERESRTKWNGMVLESNLLNAYTQFLDDQDGKDLWGKEGKMLEEKAYGQDINNVHDAKMSRLATFGKGDWEVEVLSKGSAAEHMVRIFNSDDANGDYTATPGMKQTVSLSGRKNPKFGIRVYHNDGDPKDHKGWKRSNTLKHQQSEDSYLVRAESDEDRDYDDLEVKVTRKGTDKKQKEGGECA